MSHILVVDDEPSICWAFREMLTDDGHEVTTAASAEEALDAVSSHRPDAVILDVRLPGLDGLSAIPVFREQMGDVPIIVVTAFGNLQTAVRAVEQGAFDYLAKPFDLNQAAEVIRGALHKIGEPDPLPEEAAPHSDGTTEDDPLIGSSVPIQEVFKQVALAATSDAPVLLTGESGTGKELAARAIHRHSARRDGPFVPVCLGALSPTLIESELFGHAKGAFTGAEFERSGLLQLADGGTILLDEIGDVPLPLQVKLLRAIEQREITPVGAVRSRRSNFRVIAATNQPLVEMMGRGEFREDLFFRLSVFEIHVPPLRQRIEDIPLLAEFFLRQLGEVHAHKRFTPAALVELKSRQWRGNVRELRNAVERAAVMARGNAIDVNHLPRQVTFPSDTNELSAAGLKRWTSQWVAEQLATLGQEADDTLYEAFLRNVEPALLEAVLEHCRQNRTAAARLLGLHRATLREKLRRLDLDQPGDF